MKSLMFAALVGLLSFGMPAHASCDLNGRIYGQGCCSWHGGECGCQDGRDVCCDGSFSPSCGCHGPSDALPKEDAQLIEFSQNFASHPARSGLVRPSSAK